MAGIRFSINNLIRSWALLILLGTAFPAQAILTIEIVGSGENQIPIAVVPLATRISGRWLIS